MYFLGMGYDRLHLPRVPLLFLPLLRRTKCEVNPEQRVKVDKFEYDSTFAELFFLTSELGLALPSLK